MTATALRASLMATDLRVCETVWRWRPSAPARVLTLSATRFGDGWGWAGCGVVLHASGAASLRTLVSAVLAALCATAVFMSLKHRFRRPRPCHQGPHPVFGLRPRDQFSFPSGHTMTAFAVATALSAGCPLLAPVLFAVAAGVGVSRVALGVHYPSDVLAGAMLGVVVGGVAAGLAA